MDKKYRFIHISVSMAFIITSLSSTDSFHLHNVQLQYTNN